MNQENYNLHLIDFADLETRFGKDNAFAILRTLEQFEGVLEARVAKLSWEERLQNVFTVMQENIRYPTPH